MFLEIFAALFHFDEHDRFPNVIGEGSSAAVFGRFQHTKFRRATNVEGARLNRSLERVGREKLAPDLFVASDAALIPINERARLFVVRHGKVLRE